MKRDFSPLVKNIDGRPFVRPVMKYDAEGMPVMEMIGGQLQQVFGKHEKMTFRLYALDALGGRWRGDESLTLDEVKKRSALIDKITFSLDGIVDVDSDEAKLITDCLLKQGRDAMVIGQMYKMLNTDPVATSNA